MVDNYIPRVRRQKEQLERLEEGVPAWNRWRKENPIVEIDLRGARLGGANLREALVYNANLSEALLFGANLSQAKLGDTVFVKLDLKETRGLDSCQHSKPSVLDLRTLTLSGQLPINFLRGCGLPDQLISYLPTLLNQPIQFFSCFISYSHKDKAFASLLSGAK